MPEPATPPAPPIAKTLIPTDLHEREYLKPWLDKPFTPELAGEIFKKLDGAQSLIGRKIGIPGDDAKPEEVEKFYSTLRPAKPEDYEVQTGENPDQEFIGALRAAAHTAGMSKRQMDGFVKSLLPHFQARSEKQKAEQAKIDKEFETLVQTAHGADGEKVLKRVQAALKEHTPAPLKPHIDRLDNNALAILTGVVNAVLEKYVPEADLNTKGGEGDAGAGNTREALQKELVASYTNPAWKDQFHPDHPKVAKRIEEILASPVFKT